MRFCMSLYSWFFKGMVDLDYQIGKFRQFKIAYSEANATTLNPRIVYDRDNENRKLLLTKAIS